MSQFRLRQRARKLESIVRTDTVLVSLLLAQSMESDSRAHNHWLFIDQAQEISVLQVVVSNEDVCNRNSKTFNPHSLIPPTYCHYFHTLRTLTQRQMHANKMFGSCSSKLDGEKNVLCNFFCIIERAVSVLFLRNCKGNSNEITRMEQMNAKFER